MTFVMSAFSPLTRYALVHASHAECETWRAALGPAEPLRAAVIDGPLDAPQWLPAGAMQATAGGPRPQLVSRD